MTLADMNKRAKQLLDYITRVQVDMAADKKGASGVESDIRGSRSSAMSKAPAAPASNHSSSSDESGGSPHPLISSPSDSKKDDTDAGSSTSSISSHTAGLDGGVTEEYNHMEASTTALTKTPPVRATEPMEVDESSSATVVETTLEEEEATAMQMMDDLTRELIKFQERFGRPRTASVKQEGGLKEERREVRGEQAIRIKVEAC